MRHLLQGITSGNMKGRGSFLVTAVPFLRSKNHAEMKPLIAKPLVLILLAGPCLAQIIQTAQASDAHQQISKHLKTLEDMAESVANAGVRSYALVEVARAYSRFDKAESAKLLDEAFALSKTVLPSTGKTFLQEIICSQTILLAPARLNDFLYQTDAEVRHSALRILLQRYERANDLDKAVEVVNRLANEDEFPYGDADRLISKMPQNSRSEKQALFARALASFRNHQHDAIIPNNDFGVFLTHVWRDIDKNTVRDGIDSMLQEARKQAESGQNSMQITVTSAKGSASLGSSYEYRLFQLLPVLRDIDPSAAKDLLDQYSQTKQLLSRYPNGLSSFEDGKRDQPLISASYGGANLQTSATWQQEVEQGRRIAAAAENNPQQAIDDVDTLSFAFVKADTLERIADAVSRKDPDLAKRALEKVTGLSPELKPEEERAKYMISAAELYLAMGEREDAKAALELASQAVWELYKKDSDKDDPNTALKAFWPSVIMWQHLVSMANKISANALASILKSITDQDIRLLAILGLEGDKLGLPSMPIMTVTTHKAGELMYRPEGQ